MQENGATTLSSHSIDVNPKDLEVWKANYETENILIDGVVIPTEKNLRRCIFEVKDRIEKIELMQKIMFALWASSTTALLLLIRSVR